MTDLLLSCDWGTSRCRLRLVERQTARMLGSLDSHEGVQRLAMRVTGGAQERAAVFHAQLTTMVQSLQAEIGIPLAGVPIIISGMVGSSIGWRNLRYAQLPVGLDGQGIYTEQVESVSLAACGPSCPVLLVSGLATAGDVLRGEEVEILGVLREPAYATLREDALLLLPGTHCKHVDIRDGKICAFRTHMTGELFALLSQQSTLAHSLAGADAQTLDPAALCAGIDAAREVPLTTALFHIRARQLLAQVPPDENRAYLLGLLLGLELGQVAATPADTRPILLCAGEPQRQTYQLALEHLGLRARLTRVSPAAMATAAVMGHLMIYQHLDSRAPVCEETAR